MQISRLYGISIAQTYSYYLFSRRNDGRLLQSTVLVVMLIETVHNGLLMHAVYCTVVIIPTLKQGWLTIWYVA